MLNLSDYSQGGRSSFNFEWWARFCFLLCLLQARLDTDSEVADLVMWYSDIQSLVSSVEWWLQSIGSPAEGVKYVGWGNALCLVWRGPYGAPEGGIWPLGTRRLTIWAKPDVYGLNKRWELESGPGWRIRRWILCSTVVTFLLTLDLYHK